MERASGIGLSAFGRVARTETSHAPSEETSPPGFGIAGYIWNRCSGSIRRQYEHAFVPSETTNSKQFWHNIDVLRLISTYGIVFIHLEYVFQAARINPALLQSLRFATDLFIAVAGFLSVHVLASSGQSAIVYLRRRLIRIVPLYFIFTILAFLVENYAMSDHKSTTRELLMSLSFIPHGSYPILYPTWTLEIIMECSVIVSLFYALSAEAVAPYLASAFVAIITFFGVIFDFQNPAFEFYTNPILIDFALGILIFKLASSPVAFRLLPRRAAVLMSASLIAICSMAIMLRPFFWLDLPRLIGLGLPAAGLLLGAVLLDRHRVSANSNIIRFLANCSFSIYLCHWFVNIVSDKIVSETAGSQAISILLLVITPIVVTVVAVLVYTFLEVPISTALTRRYSK